MEMMMFRKTKRKTDFWNKNTAETAQISHSGFLISIS